MQQSHMQQSSMHREDAGAHATTGYLANMYGYHENSRLSQVPMQAQMPQMILTPQNRSAKGPTALQMSGRMLIDGSSSQQ